MSQNKATSTFKARLLRPVTSDRNTVRAFVVLPKEVSETLPRRGRTTVDGTINDEAFRATLEPDGRLSHWLPLEEKLIEDSGSTIGEEAMFTIKTVEQEPEPELPADFQEALAAAPEAKAVWDDTTTIARVDWIHWIVSAKQAKTRAKRINDACEQLAAGKRRVCCFDPSGFYSKALRAPKAED